MRWSHTAVTASCAANGQTDRPKLKLVPFDWHADARKRYGRRQKARELPVFLDARPATRRARLTFQPRRQLN